MGLFNRIQFSELHFNYFGQGEKFLEHVKRVAWFCRENAKCALTFHLEYLHICMHSGSVVLNLLRHMAMVWKEKATIDRLADILGDNSLVLFTNDIHLQAWLKYFRWSANYICIQHLQLLLSYSCILLREQLF